MTYPFPDDVRNPSRDEPNPFADDHVDETETSASLGASGVATEYQPRYEATQVARSGMILLLGGLGCGLSLLGWLSYADYAELSIMPLLAFAFSLPAVTMGGGALRAMRSGKMKEEGRRSVYWGTLWGILAIGNSCAYTIVGIVVLDLIGW